MDNLIQIFLPVLFLAAIGLVLGLILAFAAKKFAIKSDPRIDEISDILPSANCGGCGYAGCAAAAKAMVEGEAKITACTVGGDVIADKIADILGVKSQKTVRMRAQVMCSGTSEFSKKKYIYKGAKDCHAVARLGGGDRLCPDGCIGLGTCAKMCKFDAIHVEDGVAAVDYEKCQGCGVCVVSCPKHLIKLIPYDSKHWVGCRSIEKGANTRKACDIGCIGCRMCEKACEEGAITVNNFLAEIDYSKCVGCDKCVTACKRNIIWSNTRQDQYGLTLDHDEIKEING